MADDKRDHMVSCWIELDLFGIDTHCPAGYVHNRPNDASYLFEYFETPVEIVIRGSRRKIDGQTGILFSPQSNRQYRARQPLIHSWFYAHGPGIGECVQRYGIPVDQPFKLDEPAFLAPFLEHVRRLATSREAYWRDAVTIAGRTFLRNLAYSISRARQQADQHRVADYAQLRRTRVKIHAEIERRWTVEDMAALVNLSSSQFTALYRKCFQTSPYQDLIMARIRMAEVLLRFSSLSVEEVAETCGFGNTSRLYDYYRRLTSRSIGNIVRQCSPALIGSSNAKQSEIDRISLLFTDPVVYWGFDPEYGDPGTDFRGKHSALQFKNGAMISPGRDGSGALDLHSPNAHAELAGSVVDTQRSYTVSAWIKFDELPDRPHWMTIVSAGSDQHCSFYLQCSLINGCYMLTVTPSVLSADTIHACGNLVPVGGEWVHLTGVHDEARQLIELWENGRLSVTLPFTTPWNAPGPTRIGASVFSGSLADLWHGMIDDVRIYDRALNEAEISTIYSFAKDKRT